MNTYQIVIASNAESTYVIFNYKDSLKWSSSSSSKSYAGVFAAGSSLEKCEQPLEHSGTDEVSIFSSLIFISIIKFSVKVFVDENF